MGSARLAVPMLVPFSPFALSVARWSDTTLKARDLKLLLVMGVVATENWKMVSIRNSHADSSAHLHLDSAGIHIAALTAVFPFWSHNNQA